MSNTGLMGPALDRGRDAYGRREWGAAYTELSSADGEAGLAAGDLERLAVAAYLTGRDAESTDAWARAFDEFQRAGAPARAARCAFWLGLALLLRGEMAPSGGWLQRAQRLIDEGRLDCPEKGLLLVPKGLERLYGGDVDAAVTMFSEGTAIGQRFGDPDVTALNRLGLGQALLVGGQVPQGVAYLDEAMVEATTGALSPIAVGIVYCAVILACNDIFDIRRAQEWTHALSRWCESQPDLVPYRGQCLVHRAQILQLHGDWPEAVDECRRACERLDGSPAAGDAYYQHAEVLRLRGEFAESEHAYRRASEAGREPQPGLALLRLAQGQADAAANSIRRVLDAASDAPARARMLGPFVDIMLAVDDLGAARRAADELSAIAGQLESPYLQALAAHASGAVLLAEGDAGEACAALRRALAKWRELDAPFDAARARVLIGVACRSLGDDDAAEMELDAARAVFARLGAPSDLAGAEALSRTASSRVAGLSGREAEVLALVATGKSNREIATALFISENTVRRHVQNIFVKVGVTSRAGATAFAYKHDLA